MEITHPISILIIDDENSILHLAKMVLEGAGFQTFTFESPIEARLKFQEQPALFSLVITDMMMRDMPGVELAKEFLALNPKLKVIFISGHSDSLPSSLKGSNTKLLFKPFFPKILLQTVNEMLGLE